MSIAKRIVRRSLVYLCTAVGALLAWCAPALACSNESVRQGPSSNLPDCRAYEMVTPVDKNGYVPSASTAEGGIGEASPSGESISYLADGPFPGSAAGGPLDFYISSRTEHGWGTNSLLPPQAYSFTVAYMGAMIIANSADLSKAVLLDNTDSPPLSSEEQTITSPNTANLFLRDNATGTYTLVNVKAPGVETLPYNVSYDGGAEDFSTVIFDATGKLTPEAPGGGVDNLYEWSRGVVSLVSKVPPAGQSTCSGSACLPAPGGGQFGSQNNHKAAGNNGGGTLVRAVAHDGSRIFFTAGGNLYVRENGETTVQLDAPAPGATGPGGGGKWDTAAATGSLAFFLDDASAGLTADTVAGSGTNIYGFDTRTNSLTDLTSASHAEVLGIVNEASEDGFYLYFVANGVLTSTPNSLGQTAAPGNCEKPSGGTCNLYVWHEGTISFIHTVGAGTIYTRQWDPGDHGHNAATLTPDGRHLAFFANQSSRSGYPVHSELFEYDGESGQVVDLCQTCSQSEFFQWAQEAFFEGTINALHYARGISDDGSRIFFDSFSELVPRDTNGEGYGTADVYEFERDGAGSCHQSPGCLYLISTGSSREPSVYIDSSASGRDVFFTTTQQLASSDADAALDLYDAREGGGFPAPPQPAACVGAACLNVPPAPIDATPGSSTFSGAGNAAAQLVTPPTAIKPPPTNAQKLAKALAACGKKHGRQRKSCRARARKRDARTAGRAVRARHVNNDRRAGR